MSACTSKRLAAEEVAELRAEISDVLWKHAQNLGSALRRDWLGDRRNPGKRTRALADEAYGRAFDAARADGWDRFERLMAHLDAVEAQLAALDAGQGDTPIGGGK